MLTSVAAAEDPADHEQLLLETNAYLASTIFEYTRPAFEEPIVDGPPRRHRDELGDLAYVLNWTKVAHASVLERIIDWKRTQYRKSVVMA